MRLIAPASFYHNLHEDICMMRWLRLGFYGQFSTLSSAGFCIFKDKTSVVQSK